MIGTSYIENNPKEGWMNDWKQKLQEFEQVQITLNNLSDSEQILRLWGANQGLDLGSKTILIPTGSYPQAIAFNPFNQLFYVANQLGNDVTIFDSAGTTVSTVQLEPSFSGFTSPVALTVNVSNGEVYAAGSISNTIYAINTAFEVSMELKVANRPIALAFNPFNSLIYVTHLLSNTVSVIDPSSETIVANLITETDPLAIIINEFDGSVYFLNYGSDSISTFDQFNNDTGLIRGVGNEPVAGVLRSSQELLVLTKASAELHVVHLQSLTITATISFSGEPSNITSLGDTGGFAVIDPAHNIIYTLDESLATALSIQAVFVNKGLVYDPINQSLFVSDPLQNSVHQVLLTEFGSQPIEVSENYASVAYDFQVNPVLLKHLKMVFSGNTNAPIMKVGHRTPSGKEQAWALSLGNRKSPQQRLNLLELFEMENEIIDGKTFWMLTLLPKERISLLLYYEQYA
jgi:YVTN family beta-propeller protein